LRAVPTDRIPFWVDLVPAAASHILPAPVTSSALSDSSRPLASSPPQQPLVLVPSSTAMRLPSWCWFDSSASPWDPGSSLFFYLQRRLPLHPSVAGVLLLQRLVWPAFNRRFARSIHPGVCVLGAPATLRRRLRRLRRHEQSCLLFQIQGFVVISSSLEDLFVNWLL
jgi:hypothetical protein